MKKLAIITMVAIAIFMVLLFLITAKADVTTTTTKVDYSCNGSTTTFDFTFPIVDTSDLTVLLRVTSTGVESTLTETTDYSLSTSNNDYSSGGTVTTIATYGSGNTIHLVRETPQTQTTTLQDSGILRVAALEDGLDRLTLIVQQLQETADRSLKFPKSETMSSELPNSVDRANQYVVFGSTGTPTVSSSGFTSDDYTVSSYMETILDDTSEGVFKATVNLETGTDVQAYDAELAAVATLTSAANKMITFTGSGTADTNDISAFGRTIIDDADGNDVFTTLGLLDEDDMAADDPCAPPSQQSVVAYVGMSAYTANDSTPAAMLKDHAYLAATDGFVVALADAGAVGNELVGFVDDTNDPAGAGIVVQKVHRDTENYDICIGFWVAVGEYFEIVSDDTPTIYWKSKGVLSGAVDQD